MADEKTGDVGLQQDYISCIKDIVALEVHLQRTAAKTGNPKYLEMLKSVRENRAKHMVQLFEGRKPEGEVWCVHPSSILIKNNDLVSCDDVRVKDNVLTHKGIFCEVQALSKRRFKGSLTILKVGYCNLPIKITPNHEILVCDDVRKPQSVWRKDFKPRIVWKKAGQITRDDFLLFPRYKEVKDLKFFDVDYIFRNEKVVERLEVNDSLMRLIGFYLAEGWNTEHKYIYKGTKKKTSKKVMFCLNNQSKKKLVKLLMSDWENVFGTKLTIADRKNKEGRESVVELCSGKRIAYYFFKQFGKVAHLKTLPRWVLDLPERKLCVLLKAYIGCDGHRDKFNVSMGTVSPKLAVSLRLVFSKLGILHNLSKNNPREGGFINGRPIFGRYPYYSLSVAGDSYRLLNQKFGLKHDSGLQTSGNHGYVLKDYLAFPIREVTKENYEGSVLNFKVDNCESYSLMQAVVHNCQVKHTLLASKQLSEVGDKYLDSGDLKKALDFYKDCLEYDGLFFFQKEVSLKKSEEAVPVKVRKPRKKKNSGIGEGYSVEKPGVSLLEEEKLKSLENEEVLL